MSTALLEPAVRDPAGYAAPRSAPIPRPHRLTAAEYLERDDAAERRSEFIEGEMFSMAGASRIHVRIVGNIVQSLINQTEERDCDIFFNDTRVRAGIRYYYPDVGAICGDYLLDDLNEKTLTNPGVVIEVLSKSTADLDRGVKLRDYLRLPSLRTYLLVSQDAPVVEQYERDSETDAWRFMAHEGVGETVELPAIGCRLPLTSVYRRVAFPDPDALSSSSE